MLRLPPPPTLPRPPARAGFPVIAVVMPLIAALVIGLITGSAFVLVFALLSPIIAIATMIDGRRAARRLRRDERERFDRECAAFAAAIDAAHAAERAAEEARAPLAVGAGPRVSAVAPEVPLLTGEGDDERRLLGLLERARINPALPILLPRGPIAVRGTGRVATAVAESLAIDPDATVERLAPGDNPTGPSTVIDVRSALRIDVTALDGDTQTGRPRLLSERERRRALEAVRCRRTELPLGVSWNHLADGDDPRGEAERAAGVAIGASAEGVAIIDLVRDGPHVLVGGTTGSGKSEFLRTLALSWAAAASPAELQLLFVDFKGGATFSALMALPHVVGLVTDLDPVIAQRTLRGLRAELARRERLLVEHGLRDAAQAPTVIPRLLVLVDEFAALIDAFPELHASFADLSARGRSLGVHLVLGTQHPAAVVRDAVAANCALRVAFRLSETAGTSFVGRSGRGLVSAPPGRALVVDADRERTVQVATIDDADIAAVAAGWQSDELVADGAANQPWLPPLPARVEPCEIARLLEVDHDQQGLVVPFGMLDDPDSLRRRAACWRPGTDGPLAIMGAPGSGRTTALSAVAGAARERGLAIELMPVDLPSAWGTLERLSSRSDGPRLLLADDLDLLLADAADRAPELLALWDRAVRALRARGGAAAATLGPASTARTVIGGRFGARVLLRALDADDHLQAGGPRGLHDRTAPPGRGWWHGLQLQVAQPADVLHATVGTAPPWQVAAGVEALVIARSVERVADHLRSTHPDHDVRRGVPSPTELSPGEPRPAAPQGAGEGAAAAAPAQPPARSRIHVADPDEWQAAWGVLSSLRREHPVLLVDVDATELRTLLGVRWAPPLAPERGEAWLVPPGGPVERVALGGPD